MFLYKNTCFSDIQQVADLIASDPFQPFGYVTVTAVNPTFINLDVRDVIRRPPVNIQYHPPNCDELGSAITYSGLTMDDISLLTPYIILIFATVYVLKTIRRAI